MGMCKGHALAGVRVLKIDEAFAPRVLRFDGRLYRPRVVVGGCAANMNKTFTTGLRPMENRQTALAGDGKAAPPLVASPPPSPPQAVGQ